MKLQMKFLMKFLKKIPNEIFNEIPNEIPNENVNKVCMELSKNVKFPLKMKQFQINLENFKCKWDH